MWQVCGDFLGILIKKYDLEHHHEDYNIDLLYIMVKFDKAFQDADTKNIDILSALEISDKIERERYKKSFDLVRLFY